MEHRAVEHRVRAAHLLPKEALHKANLAALAAVLRHALKHAARHLRRFGRMFLVKLGARETERRRPVDGLKRTLGHIALKMRAAQRQGLSLAQHGHGGVHLGGVGLRAGTARPQLLKQHGGKPVVHHVVAQPGAQVEVEQAGLVGHAFAPQVPEGAHRLIGGQPWLAPDAHEQLVHVHEGKARRGRGDDALARGRAPREVGVELAVAHHLVGGEVRLEGHARVRLRLHAGQQPRLLVEHLGGGRVAQVVALGEVVNHLVGPGLSRSLRGCSLPRITARPAAGGTHDARGPCDKPALPRPDLRTCAAPRPDLRTCAARAGVVHPSVASRAPRACGSAPAWRDRLVAIDPRPRLEAAAPALARLALRGCRADHAGAEALGLRGASL